MGRLGDKSSTPGLCRQRKAEIHEFMPHWSTYGASDQQGIHTEILVQKKTDNMDLKHERKIMVPV